MRLTYLLLAAALPFTAVAAAKPVADQAERAADPQDKMICKRFATIGSLVATNRECKTKREWDIDRESRRSMQSTSSCRADGGSC